MTIDLLQLDAEALDFACDVVVPPDQFDPDLVSGPLEVRLAGRVVPAGGDFSVSGRCTVAGELACARCLEPVPWSASEEFALLYRAAPLAVAPEDDEVELDAADLDLVFVPDGQLDLDRLAAEQASLAVPMQVLCRPDCRGLCPRCGANRNQPGACECEPEADPRWAPLAGLRIEDS